MTRKKRPAVRDRYYDMETKIENILKLFFAGSKYYAANTPSAFPNRVSRNDLLIEALTLYHFKLKVPDVGTYSFTTRCALKQTITSLKENFFTLLRYAKSLIAL